MLLALTLLLGLAVPVMAEDDCPSREFLDVPPEGHWAHAGIDFMIKQGYMSGTSTTQKIFSPNETTNRAMIVQILYRMEGLPAAEGEMPFADVAAGAWYHDAVLWASKTGVVAGISPTAFDPNGNVTREQIAVFLARYDKASPKDKEAVFAPFPDAAKVSTWATDALAWAIEQGIIAGKAEGKASYLDPQGRATRAEVATMISRYAKLPPKLDKTALEQAVEQAEQAERTGCDAETVQALDKALEAAKAALETAETQAALDEAAEALTQALAALRKLDLTALDAAIEKAEAIEQKDYTEESTDALETALEAAKVARTARTQKEMDEAAGALLAALDGLVKLDRTALEAAIAEAEALDRTLYTEDSLAALDASILNAKAALAEARTQAALDAAVQALAQTIETLELLPNWVSTWSMAEENFTASTDRVPNTLNGTTVRQIIRVTTTGDCMKLKLSNQYGDRDVVVHSLHLAKQVKADQSTIDPATDTVVTVQGEEEFVIPKGQTIVTDRVNFPVNALDNVAVTMYFGSAPTSARTITGHRGARATTYQISGNQVSTETFNAGQTKKILSWYFLCDVMLDSPRGSRAVVCFGDSITDGYGTDADYLGKKPDSYTRWTDYFAKRLQANEKTRDVSVLNEGIGANAMFGAYPTDAGKDRFARDLLEHEGVKYVIILFGVNDLQKLSNTSKFAQMKAEYEKMIALAHQNGIKVYAAPILPFGTSRDYYSAASEQVRTMINDWFRSEESGVDAIIDFESAVADPNNPKNLQERYTHSDGLHPYDGYDVMADAIDLGQFE